MLSYKAHSQLTKALTVENLKKWFNEHAQQIVGEKGNRVGCPLATYLRGAGFNSPWVNSDSVVVAVPDGQGFYDSRVTMLPSVLQMFVKLVDFSALKQVTGLVALQLLEQAILNQAAVDHGGGMFTLGSATVYFTPINVTAPPELTEPIRVVIDEEVKEEAPKPDFAFV